MEARYLKVKPPAKGARSFFITDVRETGDLVAGLRVNKKAEPVDLDELCIVSREFIIGPAWYLPKYAELTTDKAEAEAQAESYGLTLEQL